MPLNFITGLCVPDPAGKKPEWRQPDLRQPIPDFQREPKNLVTQGTGAGAIPLSSPFELVLGTGNRKKVGEIAQLFQGWPVLLRPLAEFANAVAVEETADSFAGNAELKATLQARALGAWVLAEDSGLCVAALDGEPGIHSARFAGEQADDGANNRLLMTRMKGVRPDQRTAWYTCHACLADPEGAVRIRCEARCCGRIVESPRGVSGFGYDPYFEIPEYGLTFAELGLAVKSIISHRARAIRMFQERFRAVLAAHA